ncbi:MAG TPA: FHA domain-containing protein [Candidatus Blautia stercoravium]|nr:FHA domain-containing protein [Candidatus Blautia stercoravium]
MEVSYKRSMSCSYLVLQEPDEEFQNTYQTHILLENQIVGLCSCKIQKIDGKEFFYYEITGCQTLCNLFETKKFKRKDLEELFLAVVRVMENLDGYLMNRDSLLLNPSYIYRNLDNGEYLFIWFPQGSRMADREFQNLTEYILPRIHHQDEDAVTLGYGIYKESVESGLRTESLKAYIYTEIQEKKDEPRENPVYEEETEKEKERQRILDDFYNAEEEEQGISLREKVPACTVMILLIVLFLTIRNFTDISVGYLCLGAAALLAVIGGGAAVWYLLGRGVRAEKKKNIPSWEWERAEDEAEKMEMPLQEKEEQEEVGKTVVLHGENAAVPYLQQAENEFGRQYFLQKEVNVIGKKKDCVDIWLNVATISRIHAKIVRKTEGDFLIDLNSRNGTILNGRYINPEEEYLLEDKSTIIFAESRFCYYCS